MYYENYDTVFKSQTLLYRAEKKSVYILFIICYCFILLHSQVIFWKERKKYIPIAYQCSVRHSARNYNKK